jgi:hypothetical protein
VTPDKKTLLVACSMLRDEVALALRQTGAALPVRWVAVMHDHPKQMRAALQAVIDEADASGEVRRILLAYGYCGGGTAGLVSRRAELVIPRQPDCIGILAGARPDLDSQRAHRYFFTRGWLDGEDGIDRQWRRLEAHFGRARADALMRRLYGQFERLTLIDTGAYPPDRSWRRVQALAKRLGNRPERMAGSVALLARLITGPWDKDYLVAPPGQAIDGSVFLGLGCEGN